MSKKSTTKKKAQKVSFFDSLKNYWIRAFDIKGVSTRSEFWFATIFYTIIFQPISNYLTENYSYNSFIKISVAIIAIIQFVPTMTLNVRRYHDIGLSGFFTVIPLTLILATSIFKSKPNILNVITIIFLIFMVINLILFCLPSKIKNNKYRKSK